MTNQNPLSTSIFDVITLAPADPAAGANLALNVNANARWQILFVGFRLVTDAQAATRLINLHGFDGTDIIYNIMPSASHIASTDKQYHFNTGAGRSTTGGSASDQIIALNSDMYLNIGDSLRTTITNIQTGDQISDVRVRVKQWITEE